MKKHVLTALVGLITKFGQPRLMIKQSLANSALNLGLGLLVLVGTGFLLAGLYDWLTTMQGYTPMQAHFILGGGIYALAVLGYILKKLFLKKPEPRMTTDRLNELFEVLKTEFLMGWKTEGLREKTTPKTKPRSKRKQINNE